MKKDKEFILTPDSTTGNADWIKKAKTIREEHHEISTAKEVIEQLRNGIYDPSLLPEKARQDLGTYIDHLAETIERLYDEKIDTSGATEEERAEKTISELARLGLLTIEEGREE
jgi:hypothetical protein